MTQLPSGIFTRYGFDAARQILTLVSSNLDRFTHCYDGNDNRLSSTETGALMQQSYDAANRLVTTTESGQITSYSYTVWGAMSRIANPNGSYVTMANDLNGKLRLQSDSSGLTTMTYQSDGLMRTEARLTRTTIIWDGSDCLGEL